MKNYKIYCRYERLEAEEVAGTERFEEIINKWSDGRDKSVPQELQSLIVQQKKRCLDMIDEKEKLVRELQQELMAQDSQYVKSLKRHTSDIDLILERMEAQAKMLLKVHQEELVEIEKAYVRERRELVESQKIEWEKIVKERSEKEKTFLENRDKRIDKQEANIQDLRVQNAEAFNHIKIKLETDIQSLEQQIQQMKATFQLNAEKLEYNFQVLKKRDEENTVTISQQKRRITRLQDTLNKLQEKINKQDKASKSDIQLLVDDFRKHTEQYRELQKKVNHFQATDSKRFRDIWKMNEGKARELASEVLGADEIIHRQQLGLDYTSPPTIESPLNKVLPVKLADKDVSKAILYASQVVSEAAALITSETMVTSFDVCLHHYPITVIKQVLELLCSECEFLMEDKLLRLLAPLEQEEQMMLKLDSIFKAIGVENEADIHQLVNYFLVEGGKQTKSLQLEKTPSSEDLKTVLIHPNAVLGRLWAFVDNRQRTGTDTPFLSKGVMGESYKDLLDGSFWSKIASMTPESHEKLWDPLINVRVLLHTSCICFTMHSDPSTDFSQAVYLPSSDTTYTLLF